MIDPDVINRLISEEGWFLSMSRRGALILRPPVSDPRHNWTSRFAIYELLIPHYIGRPNEKEALKEASIARGIPNKPNP